MLTLAHSPHPPTVAANVTTFSSTPIAPYSQPLTLLSRHILHRGTSLLAASSQSISALTSTRSPPPRTILSVFAPQVLTSVSCISHAWRFCNHIRTIGVRRHTTPSTASSNSLIALDAQHLHATTTTSQLPQKRRRKKRGEKVVTSTSSSTHASFHIHLRYFRRSLRQLARQFVTVTPVSHNVFTARSPASARASAIRFVGIAAASSITLVLLLLPTHFIFSRGATTTWHQTYLLASPHTYADPLRTSLGSGGVALSRAAIAALLYGGSLLAYSLIMRTLTVLNWCAPQRESYQAIQTSMLTADIPFTHEDADKLSIIPSHHSSSSAQKIGSGHWFLRLYGQFVQFFIAPATEEALSEFAGGAVHNILYGIIRRLTPAALSLQESSPLLLTLILRAGTMSCFIGSAHQLSDGERVASSAVRAFIDELLRVISPVLPTAVHVTLNYLARDTYTVISPLRGIKMDEEEGTHHRSHSTFRFTPDESSRELYEELKFFTHPRCQTFTIQMSLFVRSVWPMKYLVKERNHPFWAGSQNSPSSSSLSSDDSDEANVPGEARNIVSSVTASLWPSHHKPSPHEISSQYTRVIHELFTLLDTQHVGYLTHDAFAYLFLLQPSILEILRASFRSLDITLSDRECETLLRPVEEAERKEMNANPMRPIDEQMRREDYYRMEKQKIRANTQQLTDLVIHYKREVSERQERDSEQANLPFVCAEWFEQDVDGHSNANVHGRENIARAKTWLLRSLESSGMNLNSINDDDNLNKGKSGWKSKGLIGRMNEYLDEEQRGNDHLKAGNAVPLPVELRERFRKLMMMFRVYVELMTHAAFDSYVEYYGEMVREEKRDHDQNDGDDGEEEKKSNESSSSSSNLVRRLTASSLHTWMRDLALLDVTSTDALLTQSVLIMNDSMPHPMQIYNAAWIAYGSK